MKNRTHKDRRDCNNSRASPIGRYGCLTAGTVPALSFYPGEGYFIKTPITRIGNKNSLLPIIYSVFPLEYTRYIEVFGGSAAVLLGKPKDKFEVYNDLDAELVNLIRCIKYHSAELLLELDFLPINSREEFEELNRFCRGESDYAAKYLSTQLEIIDKMIPKEMGAELKASMRSRVENLEVRQAAAYFLRTRHSYASSGRSFACQPFNIRTTFQQIAEMVIRQNRVDLKEISLRATCLHQSLMP